MTDIFRTVGKLWIANIVAAVMFVVGFMALPIGVGLVGSLPMLPDLSWLGAYSMYSGVAFAAVGWGKVMTS